MRKRSRKTVQNQHQLQISFVKQNKQLSIQENRLNVQILRVHTIQKQRMIQHIFSIQQQQLCVFFENYQLFPYNDTFNIIQLLQSNKLKLIKNQDKIYFGQVLKKQRQGKGINISKDGKIYEGEFQKNQKNGFGIEIYPNGNLYLGDFQNNKKHGNGKFFWFSLSSKNPKQDQYVEYYQGSWWGGLPDGQGIHQKINGDFYTGSFKNGLKHSEGQQYFSNGDFYKGQYVNGLPQGYGQYTWSDKSYYKGDFKQGLRNGYGLWGSGHDQMEIYKGHYCMDKKSGYGVYQWGNGWSYKGNFDNDYRNGFGELYNGNKLSYRGFWESGQQTDKQIGNVKQSIARNQTIKRNNSSQLYNRSIASAQKSHRNSKFGSGTNYNRQQNPQKNKKFNQSRQKQTFTNHRKVQDYQYYKDFGTIHHQGEYLMKNRPQSFKSTITSFNNKRMSLTDRKGLKSTISGQSRKSFVKNVDNMVGTSISKPISRNFGNLYVPQGFQQSTRYNNRNMI